MAVGICFAVVPNSGYPSSIAAALKTYDAQMYDYFRNLPEPVLPIFTPRGEEAGDAYRDYFGGYAARKSDCFSNPRVTRAASNLTQVMTTKADSLSGELKANVTSAVDAMLSAGLKLDDKVQIRFSDVNVQSVSDAQLTKTVKRNEPACKRVVEAVDGVPRTDGVILLGDVFVAKKVLETRVRGAAAGKAEGTLSADKLLEKVKTTSDILKKLGLTMEVKGAVEGSHSHEQLISLSDARTMPIAFRPAFISGEHLQNIIHFREKGVLQAIENEVRKSGTAATARDKFPEIVVSQVTLWEAMRSGKSIPFDPKNADHIYYLRWVGLLFAVAVDVFR